MSDRDDLLMRMRRRLANQLAMVIDDVQTAEEARHVVEVIDRLEDQLGDGQNEDGWISVKDREPPAGEVVWVWSRDENGIHMTERNEGKSMEAWGYTHWRPLPDPPNESAS